MDNLALQNFFGISDADPELENIEPSGVSIEPPAPAEEDALSKFFGIGKVADPVVDTAPDIPAPVEVSVEFSDDELTAIATSPEPEVTKQTILERRQLKPEDIQMENLTRVEESSKLWNELFSLDDEELTKVGTDMAQGMREDMEKTRGYIAQGPLDQAMINLVDGSAKGTRTLFKVAWAIDMISSGTLDQIENGLTMLKESGKVGEVIYDGINTVVSGRKAKRVNEKEVADEIGDMAGAGFEFAETIPAFSQVLNAVGHARDAKRIVRNAKKTKKIRDRYNKRSSDRATFATREANNEAQVRAAQKAAENVEVSNSLIIAFEEKMSKARGEDITISKVVDGRLEIDPVKVRQLGKETTRQVAVAERSKPSQTFFGTGDVTFDEFSDLATGDEITVPILKPEKFDGIVAVASELAEENPDAFKTKGTLIDKLFRLTTSGDLDGQKIIDKLDKYGLSFEDYVLTVVGSGSEAGTVLQKLSQIRRARPSSLKQQAKNDALIDAQGNIRKGVMRVENVRRGLLVSQLATAARNLQSAYIRSPLEGLGNIMDTALWKMSNESVGNGVGAMFDPTNWRDSFKGFTYMFDGRPDEVKGFTDLILNRPELADQYDRMFNNLNEIQQATGRGTGSKFDKVMSALEDGTDFLNIPNRFQEYLVRRATFLGEVERLVKREYDIDLMDTLQQGKLKSLLNDASDVKPEGARSFIDIIDDAVTKSLDVTYAKQPDVPVFQSTSSFIVRNGLTVVLPFPRFMFNSIELMGQYAGGASIPLTKKIIGLVDSTYDSTLTKKDRERISRNVVGTLGGGGTLFAGMSALTKDEEDPESLQQAMSDAFMSIATVGAAYQYRSGHAGPVPADYKEVYTQDGVVMDTSPQFPLRQYLYLGEATRRLEDGTFSEWFKGREFVETFAGTNFRVGTGNLILDEVAQLASDTDLMTGERLGEAAGEALGNYLSTWMIPLSQAIETQRALGGRGLEVRDMRQDPMLTFGDSFRQGVEKRIGRMTVSPEEEAELPIREFLFNPDPRRVDPAYRVLFGLSQKSGDPEYAEYLKNLGFEEYDFRTSDVPSVQRFEVDFLQKQLPQIVEYAQAMETRYRAEYEKESKEYKAKVSEEKHVTIKARNYIKRMYKETKALITDVAKDKAGPYVKERLIYSRVPKDIRKEAALRFLSRNNRSPLDFPDDLDDEEKVKFMTRDLMELNLIAERLRQ